MMRSSLWHLPVQKRSLENPYENYRVLDSESRTINPDLDNLCHMIVAQLADDDLNGRRNCERMERVDLRVESEQ